MRSPTWKLALALFLLLWQGSSCRPEPPGLPAGWPLPELKLPAYASPVALSDFQAPDRPYYAGGSAEAIKAAVSAQGRLLGPQREVGDLPAESSFSDWPVRSAFGDAGHGWGVAFEVAGGGFDAALGGCETTLLPLGFQTVEYVQGQLRVYQSADRRMEVVLVAGKRWQLLLAVNTYDSPLPSELEQAQREDARRAANDLAESLKTYVLEQYGTNWINPQPGSSRTKPGARSDDASSSS